MIKFYSKIQKLGPRKEISRAYKIGDDVKCEMRDLGWFMLLEGSWESLYVGEEKPDEFSVGDEIEVVIKHKKIIP